MTGDEPSDQNGHGPGPKTHERRFHGQPERLRSSRRESNFWPTQSFL